MSIDTIDDLRNAFLNNESSSKQNFTNNYYPFWEMPEGTHAVVRFLPDGNQDNPLGFVVEKRMHNLVINGEKKSVPCMTMYGEECPICKVSSAFYDKGDEDRGKAYWRKRQYLTQAIVVEDPLPPDQTTKETYEGKVCCLALGYQLYNIVKDAIKSGELDAVPYKFKNGVDFIIKRSKQGKFSTYTVGSKFMRKNRDLSDEEVALAQRDMIDLSTLLPRQPQLEKIQEDLAASLNTTAAAMTGGPTATYDADTAVETAVDDGYQASDDGGEGGDEADAILAEIRNRKKNA